MNLLLCLAALALAAPRPVKLVVPNAAHRPFVKAVLAEAAHSRTAMSVLHSVRGSVPVVIGPERKGAYYHYDTGVLGMGREVLKEGPRQTVASLAHELTHTRQLQNSVAPSDAFEMEVEAYINDFRAQRELGVRPVKGSYDDKAQRAFRKGVDVFVRFLEHHYPDNVKHRDYAAHIEKSEAEALAEKEKLLGKLAERRKVLRALTGRNARNYRHEQLEPLERRLHEVNVRLRWLERDRKLLGDGYRKYARKIMQRARREQKKWR